MKPIIFLGDSLSRLRNFPEGPRLQAGYQLSEVQAGREPDDWKPMKTIGAGVRELRVWDVSGAFRIIYLATLPEAVLVLHAFQKKTEATAMKDLDLAAARLRGWKE